MLYRKVGSGEDTDYDVVKEMLTMNEYIDLIFLGV